MEQLPFMWDCNCQSLFFIRHENYQSFILAKVERSGVKDLKRLTWSTFLIWHAHCDFCFESHPVYKVLWNSISSGGNIKYSDNIKHGIYVQSERNWHFVGTALKHWQVFNVFKRGKFSLQILGDSHLFLLFSVAMNIKPFFQLRGN